MTNDKILDEASMLGLGRSDTDRLVRVSRQEGFPPGAWLANYKISNNKQRGTILRLLREK